MWLYLSRSGVLLNARRERVAVGYAGRGAGMNNPDMQDVKGIGPLPEAVYAIHAPRNSSVTGPFALDLIPQVGSELYGRSSFQIHGDSKASPGEASHGCIVVGRNIREQIWASGDHTLKVVAD